MQAGLSASGMTKAQIDGRRLDDIPDSVHSVALHNYYSDVFVKGFGIEITTGPINFEMKVLPQRRVTPHTGPLVFAETLSVEKKSFNKHSDSTSKSSSHRDQSPSSHKDKSSSLKKNKYVLKSRNDHSAAAKSPFPPRPVLRSEATTTARHSALRPCRSARQLLGLRLYPAEERTSRRHQTKHQIAPNATATSVR